VEPVIDCFDRWETSLAGPYTFSQSQKHIGRYRKFGFWPPFLTAIMSNPVQATPGRQVSRTRFSDVARDDRNQVLLACRELTDAV
jgi:hypothetical protein